MNSKTKKQFAKKNKIETKSRGEINSFDYDSDYPKSVQNNRQNSENKMKFGLKKIEITEQNTENKGLNKQLLENEENIELGNNSQIIKKTEKIENEFKQLAKMEQKINNKNENKITQVQKVPLIKLENLEKYYTVGGEKQMVIKGISLEIFAGETVAILGKSGSGKSTLLNILGLLDAPTSGNYFLNGYNIKTLSGDFLATTRANTFGFIFQQFNLLPKLSVIENVMMPIRYTRDADKWVKRHEIANKLLEMVEIKEQANKLPKLLSGGQQQRVAIARSLVNSPKVVIGDEPTGALDSRTANQIVKQIFELNAKLGVTVIIVTHDEDLAYQCSRVIRLVDGLIVDENTPLEMEN